jgi:hypothetical protein
VSIQDIQQDPQDITNFYLANTYQATINPNVSSSLPTSPPPFSPPTYAVWVNALWFLSLVISLTCALLATLLQQWARRYLKVTQTRYSPDKRARIRSFFAEGVQKCLLHWTVEALPTLLHVSLFLFFAGLIVFLWNVNLTIFKLILSWAGICTALYGCITLMPIFRHDSPYYTPLSLPVWYIGTKIPFVTFQVLQWWFARFKFSEHFYRFRYLKRSYRDLLKQGMQKTAEETALHSPPEIDTRAFLWTFDSLDEDHELERFFSGLPGFRNSKKVEDPLPHLAPEEEEKLVNAWIGLSDRTFSSDLLPEPVRRRRNVVCVKAFGPDDVRIQSVFKRILAEDQFGPVQSAQIAHLVRGWGNGKDEEITTVFQAIVSSVVARAQLRDNVWFALASDELGVPESVLRNHASHGDSLSLAVFIHVIRQQFSHFHKPFWPTRDFPLVLLAASNFNVLDTSAELQHEFCALWNEILFHRCKLPCQHHDRLPPCGEDTYDSLKVAFILTPIRQIFIALHPDDGSYDIRQLWAAAAAACDGVVSLSTYPHCNMHGHHSDSIPPILDVSASTSNALTVLRDDGALIPSPLAINSCAPSPSAPDIVLVNENPMFVPLLDNNVPVLASFHPAHQTVTDFLRNLATSPDSAVAGAARESETSARTMPPTTPEASTSTSFIHPSGAVSLQNNKDLAQTDPSDISSWVPPAPGLDNKLPTRTSLTFALPPREPHFSILLR